MVSANPAPSYVPTGYPYDVFLTYAPSDRDWVEGELFPRLTRYGLQVASDQTFVPGVPVIENIHQAISESRYVLAVLSPAWLTDRWARYTRTAALSADAIEGSRRFVPVVITPFPLTREIEQISRIDLTSAARNEAAWEPLRQHLTRFGHEGDLPRIRAAMMFRRVADLVRDPGGSNARNLITAYRVRFEPEVRRTEELRRLKRVHDILHDVLISCYRPVLVAFEGFPGMNSVSDLSYRVRELEELNRALGEATRGLPTYFPASRMLWLNNLVAAGGAMADAVGFVTDPDAARADPRFQQWAANQPTVAAALAAARPDYRGLAQARLIDALNALRSVLNLQPGRVNTQLLTLAGTICLRELAENMRLLLAELGDRGLDPAVVADLGAGVEGLNVLADQMDLLLALHDTWQQVDSLLRATEAQLSSEQPATAENQDHDLAILAGAWKSLTQMTGTSDTPVAAELQPIREEGLKLTAALDGRKHFLARQAFRAYCGKASQLFYDVDKKVLWLCDALGGVGRQLSRMLDA
jgi:hypothetical protein